MKEKGIGGGIEKNKTKARRKLSRVNVKSYVRRAGIQATWWEMRVPGVWAAPPYRFASCRPCDLGLGVPVFATTAFLAVSISSFLGSPLHHWIYFHGYTHYAFNGFHHTCLPGVQGLSLKSQWKPPCLHTILYATKISVTWTVPKSTTNVISKVASECLDG